MGPHGESENNSDPADGVRTHDLRKSTRVNYKVSASQRKSKKDNNRLDRVIQHKLTHWNASPCELILVHVNQRIFIQFNTSLSKSVQVHA